MSRIANLPRRCWRAASAPYIKRLSQALRTPGSDGELRHVQAAALLEIAQCRGAFLNGRVGVGKTLCCALAPRMLPDVTRVLILVPGGGVLKDTNAHFAELRKSWALPADSLLRSYSFVSNLPRKSESLEDLFGEGCGPQMIICDEADKLRNLRTAACTRQIGDYLAAHPETVFVAVTGTCDVEGLLDYAHLLNWALGDGSPVPHDELTCEHWSDVIDRGDLGKAQWLCQDLGIPDTRDLVVIRAAYKQRLMGTPGVLIEDTPFDGDLTVTQHVIDPGCEEDFVRLRDFGQRPDGADLSPGEGDELMSVWPVARRMGRGLCYVYETPPPREWAKARSAYFTWVRSSTYYTEKTARDAAEADNEPTWLRWRDIRDTFVPNTQVIWLSSAALEFCEAWGREGPGIIWVDDPPFGAELARRTGWTHYPSGGKLDITKASGNDVVIASRRAHGTGKNLQYQWNRMLFSAPPNSSRDFEQNVGRLHREGQEHPVHVDILLACHEDFGSIRKVLRGAKRTAQSLYAQKAMSVKWTHPKKPDGAAFES